MKKLTPAYKKHLLSRSRDEEQKKKRTGKERVVVPLNAVYVNQRRGNRVKQRRQFNARPPAHFNLMYENCVRVIEYINSIKKAAASKSDITVDLSMVTDIKEGAIAMLLSVVHESSHKKIRVAGNVPFDESARVVLEKSGFFDHVNVSGRRQVHQKQNFMRSGKKGDHKGFLSEQVHRAMKTVWKESGRCQTLRNIIYEMIRNSCDHAFDPQATALRWHLSISFDEERELVKFSFVDNGEGIPNTLIRKNMETIKSIFSGDADMLEAAFHGSRSRTKLPWRGKGLPSIYESYEERKIKNLLVISNGVFLHFDRQIKEKLSAAYTGTYYYWEIDNTCQKECFIDEPNPINYDRDQHS